MYAVEFESNIKNGMINIPDEYKKLVEHAHVKCFIVIDETNQKSALRKKMSAISIDTKSYKFNRDEASEQ